MDNTETQVTNDDILKDIEAPIEELGPKIAPDSSASLSGLMPQTPEQERILARALKAAARLDAELAREALRANGTILARYYQHVAQELIQQANLQRRAWESPLFEER